MLQLVDVGRQSLESYVDIVGAQQIAELRRMAEKLAKLKVIHINAAPYGGGVSELLRSLVPLENDLGLDVEWRIISGDEAFFRTTKVIHDSLQGEKRQLSEVQQERYLAQNYLNSRELDPRDYDIVVVHDAQPAGLLECSKHPRPAKWVWRCHIDTSVTNPATWSFIEGFVHGFDSVVFTMPEFVPPEFAHSGLSIIAPAIDPLSPKNINISHELASRILAWLGMFPGEPFVTQVSRFDKWKDPFGVIDAYRLVREEVPEMHLALVGSMATDDPSAWKLYSQLIAEDKKDPNLHVFTNLVGVSNIEVNAFQRLSKVVIQKSIREGFGLVVSEALWKGTPVVAGRAGGIPIQMAGGGGYLVDSVEECAQRVIDVLRDGDPMIIGKQGAEHVKDNFLMTRLLRDELLLFRSLMGVADISSA